MTDDQKLRAQFNAFVHQVTDRMKEFTRPYVTILAGGREKPIVGTGTFVEKDGISLITCEHVAKYYPAAYCIDGSGSAETQPRLWCSEPDPAVDAAFAPLPPCDWGPVAGRARPLSISKFAESHTAVENELLFFRGIADENVAAISAFGVDAALTGYCSQEKKGTCNKDVFEILWCPGKGTITLGTNDEVREKLKQDSPAGFSGSLVWNTRFVELGCNLRKWTPDDAVVTGLLRRYDASASTLLAWRVEHLLSWWS